MDQNIEESLSLEGTIGVDFEHSVVVQPDIGLQESTSQEIPMDYENTEDNSMLMETETQEIIVSDFMDDSLTLTEYTLPNDQSNDMATLDATGISLQSPSDTIVDLQYNQQATLTAIKSKPQPRVVTLKTVTSLPSTVRKSDCGVLKTVPHQVAIAPKPLVASGPKGKEVHKLRGHVPIAPKPRLNMVTSKPATFVNKNLIVGTLKKVSIPGVTQTTNKGNSVLAQIGKQLIMVPSGGQKIKLVSSNALGGVQYVTGDSGQAHIISNQDADGQNKTNAKFVTIQGKQDDNQPVVITKLMPKDKLSQARFVTVQQKTAPSQLTQHLASNKVLLKSPAKVLPASGNKKHEIIAIHAPPAIAPALTPVSGSSGVTENKVLIPANARKILVKPVTSQNIAQIAKKANISDGSHTQLHQINVPGKGVQYIRLITNPGGTGAKPLAVKPQPAPAQPKTFVIADSKGNLIQMAAEKITSAQPPSLVITNNAPQAVASILQQKLVRIAPVQPKTSQAPTVQQVRPAQSLLAPKSQPPQEVAAEEQAEEYEVEIDSKEHLRQMIEDATVDVENDVTMSTEPESAGDVSVTRSEHSEDLEQDLIVIPSFSNADYAPDNMQQSEVGGELTVNVNVECERESLLHPYSPPPQLPDDLIMRPRKPCNCTKSQCLKLYCDCFANGEFCNQCNCNNCHNNLDNEELRQKAIRGCLDRNPHAFRPKIGKTKVGGPEIVRRHNKGCNCKRSGCLKNYCECYEAKIACTAMCKCVGCRNVEETLERGRYTTLRRIAPKPTLPALRAALDKQPCTLMTDEVIEAVCQCLIAVAVDKEEPADPVRDVIDEFARCLRDVIGAAHLSPAAPESVA